MIPDVYGGSKMKTYLIAALIFIAVVWFGWATCLSGLVQETKNDLTGPVNAIEEIFDRI